MSISGNRIEPSCGDKGPNETASLNNIRFNQRATVLIEATLFKISVPADVSNLQRILLHVCIFHINVEALPSLRNKS